MQFSEVKLPLLCNIFRYLETGLISRTPLEISLRLKKKDCSGVLLQNKAE